MSSIGHLKSQPTLTSEAPFSIDTLLLTVVSTIQTLINIYTQTRNKLHYDSEMYHDIDTLYDQHYDQFLSTVKIMMVTLALKH